MRTRATLVTPLVWAMMCVAGAVTPVSGELFDRGGGLIYDDVLNITWLQDANYALTTGHPPALSDTVTYLRRPSLVPGILRQQMALRVQPV